MAIAVEEKILNAAEWTSVAEGHRPHRDERYGLLGWKFNGGLLEACVNGVIPEGQTVDVALDFGTGDGVLAIALAKKSRVVFGFDIAPEMLSKVSDLPENVALFRSSVDEVELPDACADVITMRMVAHHLPVEVFEGAVKEAMRLLKPGGKFEIIEYVAVDEEALPFEVEVFELKEKRRMWTEERLLQEVGDMVRNLGYDEAMVESFSVVMEGYSVWNWLGNSGLPDKRQQQIFDKFKYDASDHVREAMSFVEVGGDIKANRKFAHIVVTKPYEQEAVITG